MYYKLYDPDYYIYTKKGPRNKHVSVSECSDRIGYFLEDLGVKAYTINPKDFHCNVLIRTDLIIEDPNIETLPFSIMKVEGDFIINNRTFKKLSRTPREVKGDFDVSGNQLTSLAYFPDTIGGSINISNNKITKLTNTKGDSYIPDHIKGDFNCSGNRLGTLKGGPSVVDGDYDCSNNLLKNLDHKPTKYKLFVYAYNPLKKN